MQGMLPYRRADQMVVPRNHRLSVEGRSSLPGFSLLCPYGQRGQGFLRLGRAVLTLQVSLNPPDPPFIYSFLQFQESLGLCPPPMAATDAICAPVGTRPVLPNVRHWTRTKCPSYS